MKAGLLDQLIPHQRRDKDVEMGLSLLEKGCVLESKTLGPKAASMAQTASGRFQWEVWAEEVCFPRQF